MMRNPDPVELVAIGLPILIEVVAVVLFIGMGLLWMVIARAGVPV